MSWLYSQALMRDYENSHSLRAPVAEFSAAKFSGGELSAPWSGNLTPQGYSSPDRMTALSRLSRFGMTFAPLMADRGAELLTWFLAASLARTSASQAREPESTASDPGYGERWRGSLARFDPDSRSWKTAQHSLIEGSDECSVTWPRSGMTVDGRCYLLPTLERPTGASASGLSLPTPTCGMAKHANMSAETSTRELLRGISAGRGASSLAIAIQAAWPTPTSSLVTNGGRVTQSKAREGGTLIEALSSRTDWFVATPTARDWRSGKASDATHAKNSRPLSEQIGGSLSPDWVELLMGWPKGWASLEPIRSSEMRGWGAGWEDDTPRVDVGTPNRVSRLKAIGNGQVPQCAAEAWRRLTA